MSKYPDKTFMIENSKKKTHTSAVLQGIYYEMRSLSVGDYLWILRMHDGKEMVLDYIAERKTHGDLWQSIRQKRSQLSLFDMNWVNVTIETLNIRCFFDLRPHFEQQWIYLQIRRAEAAYDVSWHSKCSLYSGRKRAAWSCARASFSYYSCGEPVIIICARCSHCVAKSIPKL